MPSKLAADLLHFTEAVDHLRTPEAVLDALDAITWDGCHAHVLGAALLPLNFGTTDSLVVGKTVFLQVGGRSGHSLRQSRQHQSMWLHGSRSRPSPSRT